MDNNVIKIPVYLRELEIALYLIPVSIVVFGILEVSVKSQAIL